MNFEKPIIFRILLSVLLGCTAIGLFFFSNNRTSNNEPPIIKKELSALLSDLDRDVDSVLAQFEIETKWIRKKQFALPNSQLYRIERRIAIPPDVVPVQMNVAFSKMAQRYDARAVASENLKENTVTIHIELDKVVIQSIVLKPNRDLKRTVKKEGRTNVQTQYFETHLHPFCSVDCWEL